MLVLFLFVFFSLLIKFLLYLHVFPFLFVKLFPQIQYLVLITVGFIFDH